MKTTYWLSFALSCSVGVGTVLADKYVAPADPAASTGKPKTKLSAVPVSKPAASGAGVGHGHGGPLAVGPAVVRVENANVRAQADINSEVVVQLKENDEVTVVETLTLKKRDAGEPAEWAKIQWPADKPVWVYGSLVDSASSEVKAAKVNLRAGPGENHSVVATLQKGAKLKKLDAKGDWWKVEAPDSAHAYVAADLLESKEVAAPVVAAPVLKPSPAASVPPPAPRPRPTFTIPSSSTPPPPPLQSVEVTPSEVAAPAPVVRTLPPPPAVPSLPRPVASAPVTVPPPSLPAAAPAPAPVVVTPPAPVLAAPPVAKPATPAPVKPLVRNSEELTFRPAREETYVRRVITREGVVRSTWNVQAPSWYWLENVHNGRMMNYLYSTSTNINLGSYKGRTVTVRGEEALDERWPNIPVIRVESLQTDP